MESNVASSDLECMRTVMHVAEDRDKAWVFLNTQDLLITGAFVGTGSSLAVALVVLWLVRVCLSSCRAMRQNCWFCGGLWSVLLFAFGF